MDTEHKIDSELEPIINSLERQFFFHYTFSNSFYSFYENEFAEKVQYFHKYFDRHKDNLEIQDNLFNRLSTIWQFLMANNRFREACDYWARIYDFVMDWEKQNNGRVHKGSVFYWWGGSELIQGNFDKGYLLLNQAVEEDIITSGEQNPDTPAYKTLTMRFDDEKQYWFIIVSTIGNYLQEILKNNSINSDYDIYWLNEKFLKKIEYFNLAVLYTKNIISLYYFENSPKPTLNSVFLSQYLVNLTQQFVLIIDNFYKKTHKEKGLLHFSEICTKFLIDLCGDKTRVEKIFQFINTEKSKDSGLSGILEKLLQEKIVTSDDIVFSTIEREIFLIYLLRNYSAHDISKSEFVIQNYKYIKHAIFDVFVGFINQYA